MTEELQQIAAHRKLRLVVDTNLFISSLLSPRGSERALIEAHALQENLSCSTANTFSRKLKTLFLEQNFGNTSL